MLTAVRMYANYSIPF